MCRLPLSRLLKVARCTLWDLSCHFFPDKQTLSVTVSWMTHWFTYFSHSRFWARFSASSQNLATFTGAVVLEGLIIHGTGHRCDISDGPSAVASGRENVPTVSLVWASTHHYTRHCAFSNDYYWCGTSGFGKSWTGVWSGLFFPTGEPTKWLTHSSSPSLPNPEQTEKRMFINNHHFVQWHQEKKRSLILHWGTNRFLIILKNISFLLRIIILQLVLLVSRVNAHYTVQYICLLLILIRQLQKSQQMRNAATLNYREILNLSGLHFQKLHSASEVVCLCHSFSPTPPLLTVQSLATAISQKCTLQFKPAHQSWGFFGHNSP